MNRKLYIPILVLTVLLSAKCSGESGKNISVADESNTVEPGDTVSVVLGTTVKFNPDAFGFNTQTAAGPSWDNPEFMVRLKELHPKNLRYPGGTIGASKVREDRMYSTHTGSKSSVTVYKRQTPALYLC